MAGLWLVAALLAASAALSAAHPDPYNTIDVAFLGAIAAVSLTGAAFVGRRLPTGLACLPPLVIVVALWSLPAGELRGAVVWLILVAATALAARSRFSAGSDVPPQAFVALAISAQALLVPEPWLAPSLGLRFLSDAVLLPAVAGLAISRWVRDRDPRLALGAAFVVALQPGISPELALVFVLFAAFPSALARKPEALPWLAVLLAISATYGGELAELARASSDRLGLAPGIAWIVVLIPAALQPAPGRLAHLAAAIVATPIALGLLPAPLALAVPLLLLFETVAWRSSAGRLQATWTAALLLASTLAAGYPWLSVNPAERALSMIRLGGDWPSAAIVVASFWALVALDRWTTNRGTRPKAAIHRRFALIALGAGCWLSAWPPQQALLDQPFILSSSTPSHALTARGPITKLTVDSYISNGTAVAPGTPVARVIVGDEAGVQQVQTLRAGIESGEWAARRPGFSAVTPAAWVSWLAPDGPYFAQRYRARWQMDAPTPGSIRFERVPGIPDEVELAVIHVGGQR